MYYKSHILPPFLCYLKPSMTTYKYSNNNSNTFFSQTAIRSAQIAYNYFYCNISLIILMVPFRPVVLKLFQEEAPLRRVNSFVAPPKENSWRKHPQTYNFTYKF